MVGRLVHFVSSSSTLRVTCVKFDQLVCKLTCLTASFSFSFIAEPPNFEVGTRVIGQRADELWYPGTLLWKLFHGKKILG